MSFNGGAQIDSIFGLSQGFDLYTPMRSYSFSQVVERATEWLGESGRERFFMFLHSYEVHHPYTPREDLLRRLEGNPAGELPRTKTSIELLRAINRGDVEIDDAGLEHIVNTYDAEIMSVDEGVERLITYLKEHDLYDSTLIIFTSDHGEEFGEHGRVGWHSHTLYDELLSVPLIVKMPRSASAGAVIEAQTRHIDIAPTVLASLELAAPEGFSGVSLLGLVDAPRKRAPAAFSLVYDPDRPLDLLPASLRTNHWKLYVNVGPILRVKRAGRKPQLFDLTLDPEEKVDVSKEHPEIVEAMHQELRRILHERVASSAPTVEPDSETVKRLRSLGYIQ